MRAGRALMFRPASREPLISARDIVLAAHTPNDLTDLDALAAGSWPSRIATTPPPPRSTGLHPHRPRPASPAHRRSRARARHRPRRNESTPPCSFRRGPPRRRPGPSQLPGGRKVERDRGRAGDGAESPRSTGGSRGLQQRAGRATAEARGSLLREVGRCRHWVRHGRRRMRGFSTCDTAVVMTDRGIGSGHAQRLLRRRDRLDRAAHPGRHR